MEWWYQYLVVCRIRFRLLIASLPVLWTNPYSLNFHINKSVNTEHLIVLALCWLVCMLFVWHSFQTVNLHSHFSYCGYSGWFTLSEILSSAWSLCYSLAVADHQQDHHLVQDFGVDWQVSWLAPLVCAFWAIILFTTRSSTSSLPTTVLRLVALIDGRVLAWGYSVSLSDLVARWQS